MSTLLPRLRLAFQADESNRHIRKDSLVAEVLEQRLLLSGLWDDHGDNAATATSIAKNSWVAGNIETKFDTDYFKFYGYSGYQYTLETSAGTLIDTYLLLYDKDGATLI